MLQGHWRIGQLWGIPLYIAPSWFLVVLLITVGYGLNWQADYPDWGAIKVWTVSFSMALLLFASVLMHELGHSLVAIVQGIRVKSVTLFLFGGIAAIEQEAKTPAKAIQLAIAGPAVSLGIAGLMLALSLVLPDFGQVLSSRLASVNLLLVVFNLIPALPLDGGQVLKALIWRFTGDPIQGTQIAAKSGQILGWGAVIAGLALALLQEDFTGGWIALLAWFVLRNASAYAGLADLQKTLVHLQAKDAFNQDFRVVDAGMTLRQFADAYLLDTSPPKIYVAALDGRDQGIVSLETFNQLERSQWEQQTLLTIVQPLSVLPTVLETTPLVEVIQRMEALQCPQLLVLSAPGAVVGILDRSNVVQVVSQSLDLTIPESEITQTRETGVYPSRLQLATIAQSIVNATQTSAPQSEYKSEYKSE
jgi:Zn-dependent protease/CBS domain-containing protein